MLAHQLARTQNLIPKCAVLPFLAFWNIVDVIIAYDSAHA